MGTGEARAGEPVPPPSTSAPPTLPPARADLGPRLLAAVGYTLFFLVALDHVGRGPLRFLDRPLYEAAPHSGPLFEVSRFATALGDPIVITALALLGIFLLLRRGAFVEAGVLAIGKAIVTLVTHGTKEIFERQRPPLAVLPDSFSFPSGHATESAATLMLLAVLLFEAHRRVRPWAEGVAVGAAIMVGATRVIVGAHWPTDVVAGWGLGWGLAGSILLLRYVLQRKKALPEPAAAEAVARGVSLYVPERVQIKNQPRVAIHVEDVPQRRPRAR